jgi:transcriptional antiterminator NusG
MKKEWFVLHTLTGKENKVLESITARKRLESMEEYIGQCLIPMEKVTETKNGKKRTIKKKIFPGYVLVEMALYDESGAVDKSNGKRTVVERTWQFLRETPGVIGSWLTQRPLPLTQAEVDAILSDKPVDGEEKPRPKVTFNVDDTVKINEGAFMGLKGLVSMVDPDKGKLKVEVSVFSRKVPVDVDYWQVEKVSVEDMDNETPAS